VLDHPEGRLPLADFTVHAAAVLERVRVTGRPVVVTQAGDAAVVIVEAERHRHMQRDLALFRAILVGGQDVRMGRIVSHDDVEMRLTALLAE